MGAGAGSPSLAPPPTPFGARLPMRGRFVRLYVCTMYDVREQTQSNAHTDTNTHNVPPNDIVHIGIIQIEPEIDKRI